MDKRWFQLGDILVNYCMRVKPGERVMIAMKEVDTLPLVRATFEAAVKAGAHVQVQFQSDFLWHSVMRHGSEEQVGWVPEIETYGMEWADVYFGLRGTHNLGEFFDIESSTLALHRKAMGKVSHLRWEKTRWCLVAIPEESLAQEAGIDIETMLDTFFSACLRDWPQEERKMQSIADRLNTGSQIRVVGKETDLSFSTRGSHWAVDSGHENMPGGEIWTAPLNSTLNGRIYFEFPGVLGGRLVHDIRLEWKEGRLVNASASRNEEFLHQVLNTDEGASLLGEFAFGTNDGIQRFCNNILLDEKIGGTVHIALGRAYPEVGGTNYSDIHWDIIKDTRQHSTIYLDGQIIFENGKFVAF
jgi:aminopeptidase